jgi:hypothetical protein
MTRMDPPAPHPGPSRPIRVARALCRHVLWIALFALPGVVLWWHIWTGHPSSTLTCACGDPAQEVWFIAWPAWALSHGANLFFSGAVNVPHGANLLSNTSGTLVGLVLSPVTWLWGPVTATNVALTLAPAVSAWGCWLAVRSFVSWKPGAVVAALVYGYSAAIVTSLIFSHVSVTVLAVPPLLFALLHEMVIRQAKPPWRDGALLAALAVLQFLISPEVLVMCILLGLVGMAVCVAVGWRQVRARAGHALRALGIGLGISLALLAYPGWFGLAGPQAVSGVLFNIAPLSGVVLSGFFSPGPYNTFAGPYVRFGGYSGRLGPTPNYLGLGTAAAGLVSLALGRRRPLTWFLLLLTAVATWLALGSYLIGGLRAWEHIWMPWRYLAQLPVLREILPDQFAPFVALLVAFLLAIGLDAAYRRLQQMAHVPVRRVRALAGAVSAVVALAALVPVFVTFDMPFKVVPTLVPVWIRDEAPKLPGRTVLLTVPFAVSGSDAPMLWQAVDGMHFRLAGAALKTPGAHRGPVGQGGRGSARRILSDLSIFGTPQPLGTAAQVAVVRAALRSWDVNEVVIDGLSRDPVYASGFFTEVFGRAPAFVNHAWVWRVPSHHVLPRPALGASLYLCRLAAYRQAPFNPMSVPDCVLRAAGVALTPPA